MKRDGIFLIILTILCSSCLLTLINGETPWTAVWEESLLRFQHASERWNPLLDERLPRLIVLICTGASLAVSGAVMQALFQNSLASPSILGISSGGCLAGLLVFIFNIQLIYPHAIPLAAFLGCLLTLGIVYGMSKMQKGLHLQNLILTGIAISGFLLAIQGVILYALRDQWQLIQTITEWEAGSTQDRNWQHVHMQLPLALIGLTGCLYYREELNLLALGEEEALNLGVNVSQVRWRLFLCIALLTGGALAAIGMIAFFGLAMPHIVRKIYGPDHRLLIPLCLLSGAAFLTGIDVFLRYFEVFNISLGNFSALLGGAFFIFLLFHKQARPVSP